MNLNTLRPMREEDRASCLSMMKEFYTGPAVLHPIPEQNFETTFDLLMQGSPYADGFLVLQNGKTAGYFLTAITYSNEVGGQVVLFEEIYIKEEMRGLGLGAKAIQEAFAYYPDAKRFRLEATKGNKAVHLYERLGFSLFDYLQMVAERGDAPL